nr:DNA polymerase theta isoform X2 [Parasteatoda tepidariorum]XP_015918490.1 DNA polymerase theta isoform X2 [Parasteatoda tepidariorum]XP_042897300.1 DNA polymerase theta isoform X2 [Parasteatoda tepidariorum]
MKKLTQEWKIKKRVIKNKSFKEQIDLSLTNSESIILVAQKRPSLMKSVSDKPIMSSSDEETFIRRSQRLKQKYDSRKQKISTVDRVESFTKDSVQEDANMSTLDENYCNLSKWRLPITIVEAYKQKNIETMFQWQYECLSMKGVLNGKNLVFSAPTSAGKTLVAEILMLKNVTETKKKAIMILPFVSVVREKVHYFQDMFQNAGIVVDGYMGAHNPPGGFKSVDIAICTIEKANNLVNRLMEEKRLNELGILVVDELHMLGDYGRGYLLELLLTKLLYNCKKNNISIQIIGMSATLPNLDVLAFWLNSELYRTDFRPVPLQERFKVGNVIYDAKTKEVCRELNPGSLHFAGDSDHSVYFALETIAAGHGVLIFCPSKNWCENLATSIAKAIFNIGRPSATSDDNPQKENMGKKLREYLKGPPLNDILQQLKSSPAGLDSVLRLTVPFGVAYHHAGLTFDERDIVEGGFRQGIIKVLVATSTLSSGVNLPARRVIIRSPLFCGSPIDVLSYKQMVGRAGRKGIDEEGESILLCKEAEKKVALSLVSSELRPVRSCLISAQNSLHSSLKRALIEVIASGVASTRDEVLQYASCTLLCAAIAKESEDSTDNTLESSIDKCLNYLVDNDIIFKHEDLGNGLTKITYKPSQLGMAMLASGFSPDDALRILKELQLARRNFVLENDLHILYEVTPPYLSDQMGSFNWMHFLSIWEELPEEYKRVGELVGVQESFIGLGVQGRINRNSPKTAQKVAIHQRFYAALALNDLIQELPLSVVSEKYDCSRGILQSLQQSTSTFAGMLTIFCSRLKWHNLELLFSHFQRRVHFGIQQELCDLVRLSTLNAQRARALYNAGYETVASLASASQEDITLLLCNMGSFESAKQLDGDLAQEALERYETKRIRITGKEGVCEKEAAHLIIQEARHFIKQELGIDKISWGNLNNHLIKQSESSISNSSSDEIIVSENTHYKEITSANPINDNKITEAVDLLKTSEILDNSKSSIKCNSLNDESVCVNDSRLQIVSPVPEKLSSVKNETIPLRESDDSRKSLSFLLHELNETYVSQNELNLKTNITTEGTFKPNLDRNITDFKTHCKNQTEIENVFDSLNLETEDAVKNISFSEFLLSQTCEIGDIYFAQTSICDDKTKAIEKNLSGVADFEDDFIDSSVKVNNITLEKTSLKNSRKLSFVKNKQNIGDSFINDLGMDCMAESFSFNFQNSFKQPLNYSLSIEEENHENNKNICDLKNKTITSKIMTNVQTHSTPKQDAERDSNTLSVSRISDVCHNRNQHLENVSNRTKVNQCKINNSCNSQLHSDKELTVNETSGDIFESDDSFVAKCFNVENKTVTIDIVPNDKKSTSETSTDLFDEDCLENVCKSFSFDENESKKTSDVYTGCINISQKCAPEHPSLPLSALSKRLSASTRTPSSDPLKKPKISASSSPVPLHPKHSAIEENKKDISNVAINKLEHSKTVDQLCCNKKEDNSLKLENHSKFWTSWGSSESFSEIKHETIPVLIENDSNKDDDPVNKNVDQISSFILDSVDNDLFDSSALNCVSHTPDDKKRENTFFYKSTASTAQINCCTEEFSKNKKVNSSSLATNIGNISKLFNKINDLPSFETVDISDSEIIPFLKKLAEVPNFALSVACEKLEEKRNVIGPPNLSGDRNTHTEKNCCIINPDIIVRGISICCGGPSFYIRISNDLESSSFMEVKDKIKVLQQFFHSQLKNGTLIIYNLINYYKILWQGCNICLNLSKDISYLDPSIAAWLLDPSLGFVSLEDLTHRYLPNSTYYMQNQDNKINLGSNYWSSVSGKQRSSTEANILYHLMVKIMKDLQNQKLYNCFKNIEMPSALSLAKMEQNGLGFDYDLAAAYLQDLQKKQKDVLDKSYQIAGRRFNISSSRDISRILFKELKLNIDLAPDSPKIQRHLGIGSTARSRKLPPELKTNKECLEKIMHLHPLPKAILDWRRLSFATTKVLMPLLRKNKFDSCFQMNRLYSNCYIYTLTGRVHMHNPNLQFIPKDFNIENNVNVVSDNKENTDDDIHCSEEDISQFGVSLRNLFIPTKGSVLLAADYSQLELRILAHLSGDKQLLTSLNSGDDVFKKIASVWKDVPLKSVTKEIREQAKKICYGIIYGISAKTLAQHLKCTEEESIVFMKTFKISYPSLDSYFQSVINNCSTNGYITTITQRRRYLPSIRNSSKSQRAQAERQAINTTIQGSAADLIKAAMVKIEYELNKAFPEVSYPLSSIKSNNSPKRKRSPNTFRGGFLVLQMHDELIYEVNEKDLKTVIKIVKRGMEETTKLSVKLPVQIRTGPTWGSMKDYS